MRVCVCEREREQRSRARVREREKRERKCFSFVCSFVKNKKINKNKQKMSYPFFSSS